MTDIELLFTAYRSLTREVHDLCAEVRESRLLLEQILHAPAPDSKPSAKTANGAASPS